MESLGRGDHPVERYVARCSGTLWIKFKFSRVKVCVVVAYVPSEDGYERDRFWNDMDRTLDSVGNGYRLSLLEDLNGWIGNNIRASITGTFGVPGWNDNSRRAVGFNAENGLCVFNTYFKSRGKEYARSSVDEERYAALCEGGERNGMRPLRSLCCTVLSQISRSMN